MFSDVRSNVHAYIIYFSFRVRGDFFSCVVRHNDDRVPAAVSLTAEPCEQPTNLLKVENDKDNYKGPHYHITACLGQIYHGFDNVNQLVEMLEVNHILGVDLMVLYNHTSSDSLYPYIQSFQQDGLLDFYNWYHPLVERKDSTHFHGNFVLRNDCLYRYMYRSDYIIMTDIDELIVPNRNFQTFEFVDRGSDPQTQVVENLNNRYHTLPSLMADIKQSNTAEYSFRHVCFPDQWPSDRLFNSSLSSDNPATKYHIRTLLKTSRTGSPNYANTSTKYICKPELIDIAGVHTCETYMEHAKKYRVPPANGLLFHYRNSIRKRNMHLGSKVDRTMHSYADGILNAVEQRHRKATRHIHDVDRMPD